MKKLLLILICLFVSSEAKSKYIALECEVKKKLYRITNDKGRFDKNVIDKSFDLITLYFDEKLEWLNESKIDKKYRDKRKYDKEDRSWSLEVTSPSSSKDKIIDWTWWLDDEGQTYSYSFRDRGPSTIATKDIKLNKDSGYFKYDVKYQKTYYNSSFRNAPFYEMGKYSDGFVAFGICKKIKKSLF